MLSFADYQSLKRLNQINVFCLIYFYLYSFVCIVLGKDYLHINLTEYVVKTTFR